MAKRTKKVKKLLTKEIHLTKSEPKSRLGKFLTKSRSLIPKYFINSWRELKKVTWPSRKESIQLVGAVVLFTAFFTLVTVAADYVFNLIVERVIL